MDKRFLIIFLISTLLYSKSFLREDYLEGYIERDLNNSETIAAVLPFIGEHGESVRDYAELYLGMHTNLNIIERAAIDSILAEQDLEPERLSEELRTKIKELFGADVIVFGKVWSKEHISFLNIFIPWNWKDIVFEHWFVKMRIINADTGEIQGNYYLRDNDSDVSIGLNEYYLSETIEKIVLRMVEDNNKLSEN